MKVLVVTCFLLLGVTLAACTQSTCLPGAITYLHPPYPTADFDQHPSHAVVEIGWEEIDVDEIISGVVCNDSWSGTVYVTCDLQIPAWDEEADFFKDCELQIDEGAVVYVEAHGDQPYYQGCSCHQ
jgi:hypothetical protein